RVQDRTGRTIYRHDDRSCESCWGAFARPADVPTIVAQREQLADPVSVYQVTSMMQGVIERGTATRVRMPGRPLAGKTGTTNDAFDAWFVGYSTSLVVGVYVGFDTPRTLGPGETGGNVAAPIFRTFMEEALEFMPASPFPVPSGARLVRISRSTGLPPEPGAGDVILEAFKPGSEPRWRGPVIGDTMEMAAPQYGIGPEPGFYPHGQYAGGYNSRPASYGGWMPSPQEIRPSAAAPYDPQRLSPPRDWAGGGTGGGSGGGGPAPAARPAPAPSSPGLQGLY
ncbi:MAG: penicillin-binding transpeptidase domain-containing protein, partial [Alphaproteobacteria bacterium]